MTYPTAGTALPAAEKQNEAVIQENVFKHKTSCNQSAAFSRQPTVEDERDERKGQNAYRSGQQVISEQQVNIEKLSDGQEQTDDHQDPLSQEGGPQSDNQQPDPLRRQASRYGIKFVSIADRDYLTVDDIQNQFTTSRQWKDEHANPIRTQLSEWSTALKDYKRSKADELPLEEMALVHMVRELLLKFGFVPLSEDFEKAHDEWHKLIPFLFEARKEIKRTKGFLKLLHKEKVPYEAAWHAFWEMMKNAQRDQREIDEILETLLIAMRRFYFLLRNANNSFHKSFRRAAGLLKGEKPRWYIWDCEKWRNEQWEFHNTLLEDMLEDGPEADTDEEEQGSRLDGGGSEEDEDGDIDEASDEESEERERQLLSERDWLRQQMGLY